MKTFTYSCNPIATTLSNIMRVDQWEAIFGTENEIKDDEITVPWNGSSFVEEEDHHSCDPNICRMTSGICVDCTKCANHCTCSLEPFRETSGLTTTPSEPSLNTTPPEPTICDPSTCEQVICGDCMRCTDHCTCQSQPTRLPLRQVGMNYADDACLQSAEKKVVMDEYMRMKY